MHHIASDGWSMGILVREVAALYAAFAEGRPSPLPELPVQYADFAVWQRSWLHGEVLESEIAFWRRQLAGLPPLLELPTDRPRPAVQSYRGASRPVRLPAGLTRQVEALARREGATLFMVLLAGFQALLARSSGQDDLAVGSPVAGRNRVETEGLIGFFVNTLVLRGDLSGASPSFRELLGRVRETALAAYLHQDVPFEKLVEELAPERSLAHTPLFQVMLVLQNAPVESLEIRDLRLRPVGGTADDGEVRSHAQPRRSTTAGWPVRSSTPPTCSTPRPSTGCSATSSGCSRGCRRRDPDRAGGGAAAARAAAERAPDPDRVERHRWPLGGRGLCAPRAVRGAGRSGRRTPSPWSPGTGARPTPSSPAGQPARPPPAQPGVGPEVRVGVFLERPPDLVVGLLGILKAGGAYVPLDPRTPGTPGLLLEDTGAPVLLTQEAPARPLLAERTPPLVRLDATGTRSPGTSAADRDPASSRGAVPDHLAYVIYTSGSTGRPKGWASPTRAWSSYLGGIDCLATRARRGATACCSSPRSASTSASTRCSLSLLAGGTLVLRGRAAPAMPAGRRAEQRARGRRLPCNVARLLRGDLRRRGGALRGLASH